MPTATRRAASKTVVTKSSAQEPSSGITVPDPHVQPGSYIFAAMNGSAGSDLPRPGSRHDSLYSVTPTPRPAPHAPHSPASSNATIGFESVGQYMQELMDTMRKLEHLGVERSEIPVPKIITVGDQSAGKSSFIEAISQTSVPRNAGTCTRCPTQITTSSSEGQWTCAVNLVSKYAYYDEEFPASHAECYVPGPFHPWQDSEPHTFHFATLTDPSMVCKTVERAQAAILHPSQSPSEFQSGRIPRDVEVKFSPNYISLEISGPGLPNLSFIDLPGVISRTRNPDEAYLVKLVENLVLDYISKECSIVLLAIALEQDQEHSRTSRLIEEAGAKGRCVGVLTKPDRLAVGTPINDLDSILSGRDLPLGHGYYVTKQPDQTQRSIGHSDARALETIFFSRQVPWSTELAHHQARFGTKNIQNALSNLLFEQITALLPEIREKLTSKLQLIDEELATLPEVLTRDVIHTVSSCITSFTSEVRVFVRGRYPDNGFRSQWREEKETLRSRMVALRPRLQLSTARDKADIALRMKNSPSKTSVDVMDLTGEDDAGTPTPVQLNSTPKKRKTEEGAFSTPATPASVKRSARPGDQGQKILTIDEIQSFLDDYSAVDSHGAYDPEALDFLILKSLESWQLPARELLAATKHSLSAALTAAINKSLHAHVKTELYATVRQAVNEFLRARLSRYEEYSKLAYIYEQHQPSSLHDTALKNSRNAALQELREARFRVRAKKYVEAQAEATGKTADLEHALRSTKDRQTMEANLGADPAEREIDVMSKIRGYYGVASMRYADNLYRALEIEVFEELRTGLEPHLVKCVLHAEADVQAHCAQLLAEDPASERRRAQLRREKEHLQAASQMLDDLALKYGADPHAVDGDEPMC